MCSILENWFIDAFKYSKNNIIKKDFIKGVFYYKRNQKAEKNTCEKRKVDVYL